jgi:hypothetical protein
MNASSRPQGNIARLHTDWEEINSDLRRMEQVLSDAIGLYLRGQTGKPERAISEVERLRALCGERFDALMIAIREG